MPVHWNSGVGMPKPMVDATLGGSKEMSQESNRVFTTPNMYAGIALGFPHEVM